MLDVHFYHEMMNEVTDNLKNEIKELTFKVQKARELENWGTYKNLILAYKEVIQLYKDIVEKISESTITDNPTKYINNQMTIKLDDEVTKLITKSFENIPVSSNLLTPTGFIKITKRKDMYIEPDKDKVTVYYNGKINCIQEPTYKDAVNRLCELIDITNFNIYVNTIGVGQGFADELDNRDIEHKELKRYFVTKDIL